MEETAGGQAVPATLEGGNDLGGELIWLAALTAFTPFGHPGATKTLQASTGYNTPATRTRGGSEGENAYQWVRRRGGDAARGGGAQARGGGV